MQKKVGVTSALAAVMGVLIFVSGATAQVEGNTLGLDSSAAPAGDTAEIEFSLANEDAVGGIQADIVFDPDVAVFNHLSLVDRAVDMTAESRVVEPGRLRVVLYFSASGSLPHGAGALAQLSFTMQGDTDDDTALEFEDILLSDADGFGLDGIGTAGHLTVLAPQDPPALTIAVLKNPGRTQTMRVMVTVTGGSGSLPTVTASDQSVVMSDLGGGVFGGQVLAPINQANLTFVATDTNSHGTGTAQFFLTLP